MYIVASSALPYPCSKRSRCILEFASKMLLCNQSSQSKQGFHEENLVLYTESRQSIFGNPSNFESITGVERTLQKMGGSANVTGGFP